MIKKHYSLYFFLFSILFILGYSVFATDLPFEPSKIKAEKNLAMILLVVFVSIALLISFLCSIAEAVLLSIIPAYIENQKSENSKLANHIKKLREDNIDRSLAAILTMNTIAHTVGAIEAGAQASIVFGSNWVGLFSAIITLMILVFSEIIPKTLGAVYWSKLVGFTQLYIRGLIIMLYPLVLISELITKLIAGRNNIHTFSRDELIALAGVGAKNGQLDKHEFKIIYNLLKLRRLQVSNIMTPRTVIESFNENTIINEAQKTVAYSPFSRFPLLGKDIDDIKGFVLKDDILAHNSKENMESKIESLKRDIHLVPESTFLPKLLHLFLEERLHIAVVVDEFGGTKGIVTLEDVLETLLGMEIVDELDNIEDMQSLARQKWMERVKKLGLKFDDNQSNKS